MKKLLPIFISVIIVMSNVLSANASGNILRGVDVRRGDNSYSIELTSTKPAQMTKTIVSANRILINLQNIDMSSNLTTKFNGNSVIDNVMVEPCGIDNVNIMVQGDNIAYSNITFKEPSALENAEDTVKGSFSSLFGIMTGSSKSDRSVQYGALLLLCLVLFGEIKFIKSKYDELKLEKQELLKNIDRTQDFQDYLPGYGKAGLKKPFTTPVYNNGANVAVPKQPVLNPIKTYETMTLNRMLNNQDYQENRLINNIANNKPVFGRLSLNEKEVTNPVEKSRLKANVKYLEEMTALYRDNATVNDFQKELRTRLNRIY